MANVQDFLSAFGGFLCFLYYMYFRFIFNGNHWENVRITIIHVYFSALTLVVSLGSSLNPRPSGLGLKPFPRATANVNA